MGIKSEKMVKNKRLLSLFGQDCTKREKKRRYDIEIEDLKEKSGNAPMIGATNRVNKKLGGDR